MTDSLIETLRKGGALDPVDVHLAEALVRLTGTDSELAALGAAVASHAVGQGHVCADLTTVVSEPPIDSEGVPLPDFAWPNLETWLDALRAAAFVATEPAAVPIILDGSRLYLSRYFTYERSLAAALLRRAVAAPGLLDATALDEGLARLFPNAATTEDAQARAARVAAESRLAIISGGPGTGKTTTVARILALLIEQNLRRGDPPPTIDLLAPTGKAAQRLGESIAATLARGLATSDEVIAAIPREAATIHRRLGYRFRDPTRFRHDRDNPLFSDIVIVDEASMVDLALMSKLVDAVAEDARLIFLGDRDQLASVEAGAIFGDICLASARPGSLVAQNTVHLEHQFRFESAGAIGELAGAIRSGDAKATLHALRGPTSPPDDSQGEDEADIGEPALFARAAASESGAFTLGAVQLVAPPASGSPVAVVADEIVRAYRPLLEAATPEKALERLSRFRVLCAHRRGRFGVNGVGPAIERLLVDASLIPPSHRFGQTTDQWFAGRPVMVTQNDYQLDLFNGDVGIVLPSPGEPDRLRAWFPDGSGGVRSVQPARLPPHETCFAMTIHKSQGSEFGSVIVILPERPSPIGTRELLYTAVTRARGGVTIIGHEAVVEDAVGRRVVRASGLRELL